MPETVVSLLTIIRDSLQRSVGAVAVGAVVGGCCYLSGCTFDRSVAAFLTSWGAAYGIYLLGRFLRWISGVFWIDRMFGVGRIRVANHLGLVTREAADRAIQELLLGKGPLPPTTPQLPPPPTAPRVPDPE